jgi:hypothetical protein
MEIFKSRIVDEIWKAGTGKTKKRSGGLCCIVRTEPSLSAAQTQWRRHWEGGGKSGVVGTAIMLSDSHEVKETFYAANL